MREFMSTQQPHVFTAGPRRRRFTTSAVAIQAIIIDQTEQVLLLSSPTRKQGWQVVSGALEASETLLDGTLREVHEELGTDIQVRPLGTVHAETFHYDQNVPYMLSTYYLLAYLGGTIQPGDDMIGSAFRWWSVDELDDEELVFHASAKPWMLRRAAELYRLWRHQPNMPLQPALQ
jgi:ADP-ribose pyrophosphatase YjhB (NUDIX family)